MKAEIRFTIEPPVTCNREQFEEWINFALQRHASIDINNPLSRHDLDFAQNGEDFDISIS